ncbi:MAG: 4-hydroxythreonine-4-phosphate dehydrogenase PdxA [Vicinamibacterales bacterium]
MQTNSAKPRVALTVGDPSGIGPEIAAKAMADPRVRAACEPVLYGPPDGERYEAGVLTAGAGRASYEVVVRAVRDAENRRVDAIATAPVNKHAWSLAGLEWKGHTELLADLAGSTRVAMLFWSEPLKVVLATVHVPLAEVPARLTRQVLDDVIALTASELPAMGLARPRVALAGLNPHAGEDGVIGHDEENVLRPAVEAARAGGVNIEGPFPADTLFVRASRGEFDVVIACYHDQGLIPVKLLAFGRAVNVTIGLPIIRTSVDHGTAFDIAGKGVADPSSMVEAVLLAAHLARLKRDRRDGGSFRPALRT